MGRINLPTTLAVLLVGTSLFAGWYAQSVAQPADTSPRVPENFTAPPKSPAKIGHPSFMSPHASPIALHRNLVFVVNTPSDTVDVIDTKTRGIIARVSVGIDPVSIAIRPDGREIWVANHVSDSVSVIDIAPANPTYLQVIATIQEFDRATKATRFDEPVGIAFAGNDKAYVALSSENKIAVVNVLTRKVEKRLNITAQDPRAIVVRGDRLYVLPFESNNKTQLSGGYKIDGDLVTFNAHEHSIANNNVLSLGHVTDIVKHPRVPDRDLYVFDTRTDKLVEVVDTLGTLLYGLAVDSGGRVFVTQADARNDINGRSGTKKHSLKELGNRAFLNQVTSVKFSGDSASKPTFINLEPLPPKNPGPGQALATPFAIQVSSDDSTLFVSAAGSDKIFTVDAASGDILGRVTVGAVPRGIALESAGAGKPSRAWVFNAVANTVSLVNVSDPARLKVQATITLQDPTHAAFKRGRVAFNKAAASTTETFSCASCHPDGHTDQLLWVLQTPVVSGGNQIMPRSTMPIRGLRDTAPFHWDGIPGDPYGGNNSANIHRRVKPNSSVNSPESSTRHLIDAGLASTMATVGSTRKNDEDKAGLLTARERDDMAKFLLNVTYPPAQRRAYTNVLSERARTGFDLFHIKGDNDPTKPRPNICGDCHRMPFWVSTNTPGTGMDAPTWRGAYDRFLILPQGRLNIIDFDFYRRVAEEGIPERRVWQFSWAGRRRFDPVWDMVLEGSTGFSGAFARQVTLNKDTAEDYLTGDLLNALESSSSEGGIVLQLEGVFIKGARPTPARLQFENGNYVEVTGERRPIARAKLLSLASEGKFVGTFTARHGENADYDHPQPALWTLGPIQRQRGAQKFPVIFEPKQTMTVSGRHIREGASLIVDGKKSPGTLSIGKDEKVMISLETLPAAGMHFLQIQNPNGLFSNDFIFHVSAGREQAGDLADAKDPERIRDALAEAISTGSLAETRKLVATGAPVNGLRKEGGMMPLSTAAFHDKLEIAKYLISKGARLSAANADGNTPLHISAFLCRTEITKLFLNKGASVISKNRRGESPIDVVSSPWNDELAGFYTAISDGAGLGLDNAKIQQLRPRISSLLREHAATLNQ
ncbi:MAG: ankyrin repeat domain-containing protein [Verrucomicrobiales bacterium]